MSYIQIEIGGKLRGLKFDQGALIEFKLKAKDSENPMFLAYALVWAGLVSNAFRKGEDFIHTFEDVCDWADKLNKDDIEKISSAFKSTQTFATTDEGKGATSKKKLVQKNTSKAATK